MYVWADRPEGYRVFRCLQTHFVETRSQGEKQKKGHRLFVLGFVWTPGTQTMTSSPPHQAGYVRLGLICFVWFYLYYFCSFKYSPLVNLVINRTLKSIFCSIYKVKQLLPPPRLYVWVQRAGLMRTVSKHTVEEENVLIFLVENQRHTVALNMYYSVSTSYLRFRNEMENGGKKIVFARVDGALESEQKTVYPSEWM